MCNLKKSPVSITIDHIRKIYLLRSCQVHCENKFSKILIFMWKLAGCPWQQVLSVVFLQWPSHSLVEKSLPNTPVPHKEFVSCSFQWKWYSVNVVTSLAHNSNNHTNLVLEISNHHNWAYSWSTSHSVTQVKKVRTQGSRYNTNNFSCIINDIF